MMIPSTQPKRNSIVMRVLLFVCGVGIFVGVSHITSLSTEKTHSCGSRSRLNPSPRAEPFRLIERIAGRMIRRRRRLVLSSFTIYDFPPTLR